MSEESTSNAKKSRSLSDAERRLLRRQKRILNNANDRLGRITSTHSSSSLNTEPSSTLTSRSVSPQPSLTSSPITYEAPDSIFSSRKNTGNFESLPPPLYSDSPLQPSPDRQTFTPLIRINNDTDPQKLKLTNLDPANSSSASDGSWSRFTKLIYKHPREMSDIDQVSNWSLFWYFVTVELILQTSRLWEDICVLGFVVGFYIMISPILSTFLW
ncbi:16319_t:CDS:2 [Gigaspora rosea]|nr:16319_t:CDS:2 [Gigaspora rosea]